MIDNTYVTGGHKLRIISIFDGKLYINHMIFLNSNIEFGVMNILEYTINNNEHAYYISVSYINYDTHVKIWNHHIVISLVLPCKGTYSSNCLLFKQHLL